MRHDELHAGGQSPLPAAIPVLCDNCRGKGVAGDARFAAIPDIMAFAPVPRRAHVNNWTETHQRAFIAALAITGSPRQAARAVGRHQFGAEQLRRARGGKSFAAAWDAALDIAREREAYRVTANLSDLADEREAELVRMGRHHHDEVDLAGVPDHQLDWKERREKIELIHDTMRHRMLAVRHIYLLGIAGDPAKRAAWEVLAGPMDWDRLRSGEPTGTEPFGEGGYNPMPGLPLTNMTQPGMILTTQAGFLNDLAGYPGPLDQPRHIERERETMREAGHSEEMVERKTKELERLFAAGWTVDQEGNLWGPDHEPNHSRPRNG